MIHYAVIIAGGSGTRLWPLSRNACPKQALTLIGQRSMFQLAVDRISGFFEKDRIIVVTRREHKAILSGQIPDLPADNFILEPQGRGTAPAIGLAAIHLKRRTSDAIMAILPADHFISQTTTFNGALNAAFKAAARGFLVTLGIKPTHGASGFGYIKQGKIIDTIGGFPIIAVSQFIEKPSPEDAAHMAASGEYTWNSGMFIWRVDRILEELKTHMPAFHLQLEAIEEAAGSPEYMNTIDRVWPQVEADTIDYAVMEKAKNVVVIPVDIGWTDVGNWSNIAKLLPADSEGNTVVGTHIGMDTHNSLVIGKKRLIGTIGINGMVIIDTDDALLVCPKEREQDVRKIVKMLGEKGMKEWL
jgi:mannose-1-phosphate guanylyltransferase